VPSRWKRITNNKKLAAVVSCVAGMTIYVGFVLVFGYVLPRFTSAMFLNILWGTLEALLITSVMFRVGTFALASADVSRSRLYFQRQQPSDMSVRKTSSALNRLRCR
jgi:uncharacterized membrane protein (DUF485 family)